jgi:general secretion pathway protein J
MTGPGAARARAGLTLVEVMVALAVLSLVTLVVGASLRGLSQSTQRLNQRVESIDSLRVGSAFLRDALSLAVSVRGTQAGSPLLFDAAPDRMAWVAVMPVRFGASGRHVFRLAAEGQPDGSRALVLRYAAWPPAAVGFPDWSQTESRVLLAGLERLNLSYEGSGVAAGWQPTWDALERLPGRVRIDVEGAGGAWPPLILPLRAQSTGRPVFSIGGSAP